jgi:hypothetical protein
MYIFFLDFLQRNQKYYWKEHTLRGDGYFAPSINNVSKEAAENYLWNRVEVDTYLSTGAEDSVILSFVL